MTFFFCVGFSVTQSQAVTKQNLWALSISTGLAVPRLHLSIFRVQAAFSPLLGRSLFFLQGLAPKATSLWCKSSFLFCGDPEIPSGHSPGSVYLSSLCALTSLCLIGMLPFFSCCIGLSCSLVWRRYCLLDLQEVVCLENSCLGEKAPDG